MSKCVSRHLIFSTLRVHLQSSSHDPNRSSDPRPATSSLRIDDNGKLYGDYDLAACGISSECKKYFIEESCFYECDRNVGKWRKHVDCDDAGEDNGWEISGMPVKASYWDAWYEACKDDYFAWGDGGYWDLPTYTTAAYKGAGAAGTNTAYTSCTKFSDTYKNGKAVAEDMWGGAFTYETNEAKGYVMTFTDGQANPNNALFTDKAYPRECAGHEVNITHPGFDTDGKTRRSYSDLACPVDWHKESSAGVSERSSRDTLTCDTAANAAYTKVVSGSECKATTIYSCPVSCESALDALETACFGMEFTYTPVGGTETYGDWNTQKLSWYNIADAARTAAGNNDACDDVVDNFILAATPSPAGNLRAPFVAIMGVVFAALAVIT